MHMHLDESPGQQIIDTYQQHCTGLDFRAITFITYCHAELLVVLIRTKFTKPQLGIQTTPSFNA